MNLSTPTLYSTMFQGHSIRVISVEAHEYRDSVEGKMLVSINLKQFDPENIDNEVTISRAINALIKDINDWPDTAGEIFKATDLRLEDSMFIHLGGDEWLACISYTGSPVSEDSKDFEYGSLAWQRDRGIPARSA